MNSNPFKDFIAKAMALKEPAYFYIVINVALFVVGFIVLATTGFRQSDLGVPLADPLAAERVYTFLIYHFFHIELFQLAFNMLMLFWLGSILSDYLKPRQFHFIYLVGGTLAAAISFAVYTFILQQPPKPFLLGSTGAVMAIAGAAATLVPDYAMRLLLFGWVKLKYLVLVILGLDLFVAVTNPAGSLAVGGALFGFFFIRLWKKGKDLSSIFKKKATLKVVRNKQTPSHKPGNIDQQAIDAVLDKISKSGYDKLTTAEKQLLFRASNNDG